MYNFLFMFINLYEFRQRVILRISVQRRILEPLLFGLRRKLVVSVAKLWKNYQTCKYYGKKIYPQSVIRYPFIEPKSVIRPK